MAPEHWDDDQQTSDEFHALVTMTPSALEKWLATGESRTVGQKKSGRGESTGHHMGHEIVELLHKKKADLGEDDVDRMRKVTGSIERHTAHRHDGDITATPWRSSPMNWGHAR